MLHFQFLFFVFSSLGFLLFFIFYSPLNYNNPLIKLRNDFEIISSYVQKLLVINSVSLHSFKNNNLFQKRKEAVTTTRNVPSILSVESPYTKNEGKINLLQTYF